MRLQGILWRTVEAARNPEGHWRQQVHVFLQSCLVREDCKEIYSFIVMDKGIMVVFLVGWLKGGLWSYAQTWNIHTVDVLHVCTYVQMYVQMNVQMYALGCGSGFFFSH